VAIAWTTVATLVLLLPGFLFFTGLSWPEQFSRDTTPKSPVGQLAAIVLVALGVHGAMGLLLQAAGVTGLPLPRVDYRLLLSVLQPGAAGAADLSELSQNMQRYHLAILAYVASTVMGGFLVGWTTSQLALGTWFHQSGRVRRRPLGSLLEHAWVYDLTTFGDRHFAPTYAHILTKVQEGDRRLMYRGPLHHFALQRDGRFSYLVIRRAERTYLTLDESGVAAPGHLIGVSRTQGDVDSLLEAREVDFLYVDGSEVTNVVFERFGFDTPGGVAEAKRRVEEAEGTRHAREDD